MKMLTHISRWMVCAVVLLVAGGAVRAENFLIVGNQKANCPDAQFTTIQAALDASFYGDRIHICSGTYPEQLTIMKTVHIEADNGVILQPANMVGNATSLLDISNIATVIEVINAPDVVIEGLIVDGNNNGISACSPQFFGIVYQNSSGRVENVTVRNIKLSAALSGCQSGTALFVQSGRGEASEVEVKDSVFYDYQKNGITADEAETTVKIHDNVVTGSGPTAAAAQNGIQVGFGAKGTVQSNTVMNNIFGGCTDVATCTTVATGILVEQADNVELLGNTVGLAQVAIFVNGNNNNLRQNQVSAAEVFDGIRIAGNGNRLERNEVSTGPEAGILLDGNNNVVQRNVVVGAGVGIFKVTGSAGNLIANNSVFSSLVRMQDPVVGKVKASAER